MQALRGDVARQSRSLGDAMGSGKSRWRTDYFGGASGNRVGVDRNTPQAFLVDMKPENTIKPHFHDTDQFQVLVAGSGKLGRNEVPILALHYVDHHTGYGPIISGRGGLSFFTIRARRDSGPVYLHDPKHKEFLKSSKKRYVVAANISLSTEPVMEACDEIEFENLFQDTDSSDGLGAFMVRVGAGKVAVGPSPSTTAGQYYLVVNGSLKISDIVYPVWSLIYLTNTDDPFVINGGPHGVETLLLSFPRQLNSPSQ
ncbi:MAG: hypothetical protein JW384_01511 [Nitrosomonadaceae bacterium]|nr:hypothetical protein [Nitrosomonadaceae bacterium]